MNEFIRSETFCQRLYKQAICTTYCCSGVHWVTHRLPNINAYTSNRTFFLRLANIICSESSESFLSNTLCNSIRNKKVRFNISYRSLKGLFDSNGSPCIHLLKVKYWRRKSRHVDYARLMLFSLLCFSSLTLGLRTFLVYLILRTLVKLTGKGNCVFTLEKD